MRQFDTLKGALPVAAGPGMGFSSWRGAPKAAFIGQLIAERHHMATQRARRQAPMSDALRTYDAGGKISVRRLPPGYRMSVDA
ncbi:MAG: hypothetical protein ABI398_04670 [Devosia sp.]